jgi:hypothetical protein
MSETENCRDRRNAVACIALASMLAMSFAVGVSAASAGRIDPPGHDDANQCSNEFGVDLNELYGISDQFRTRNCQVVSAGEHWVIGPVVWIVNQGPDLVYPDGYVPSEPEPIDDFTSKLVSISVVVDGGTKRETVRVFSADEALRTDITIDQIEPGAWDAPYPMASMLPRMRPLSVGDHTFQVFIELSAEHCDGFVTDPELSCLPAGEIAFTSPRPLTITRPAHE